MKNVIITGSANGVGKSIAQVLKENNLILIDEDKENLEAIANETNSQYFVCDLSDEQQITSLTEKINMNK